jgi:putative hemolysin
MKAIGFEIIIIVVLILANGIFAMAEIAVVVARKERLRMRAAQGSSRAQAALDLAESPNRFLATVQIGITLAGILAGAYGGATIAARLQEMLANVPWIGPYAGSISVGLVVLFITFLSVVLGELVPKRFALANPEGVAVWMARPMRILSTVAHPLVRFLGVSTDAFLMPFGFATAKEPTVSEEEVRGLMQEGLRAGAFNQVESQIVNSALGLDQVRVGDIMMPRSKIIWLNRNDDHATIWHKLVVSGHSSFPVYENNRDRVVGIVSLKAIYANVAAGAGAKIADLMTRPVVVPASQTVIQLLETFRREGKYLVLVADEFGSIVGLVTLHDVMEALVGELPSPEDRARPSAKQREDGSWLIDGMLEIGQVEKVLPGFKLSRRENDAYKTLAGFVLREVGHVPKEGETVKCQGYVFEVLDMDGHRVDKVLVVPAT